jgi:hypothetical protein
MASQAKQAFQEIIMANTEDRTGTWHAYSKTASSKSKSRSDKNPPGDLSKLASLKSIPFARDSRFANYLAVHFPEVAATIEHEDLGMLHLEVSAFKLATHDAILKNDWSTVRTHFAFCGDRTARCNRDFLSRESVLQRNFPQFCKGAHVNAQTAGHCP